MGSVGDVDAAGVAVDVNVVPAFVAGNGNSFDDVIAGGAGLGSGAGKCSGGKKSDGGKLTRPSGINIYASFLSFFFCFVAF